MIAADNQKLEPGALFQLIELDGESRGMGILRYHAHQQRLMGVLDQINGQIASPGGSAFSYIIMNDTNTYH
jgi:phage-related protein